MGETLIEQTGQFGLQGNVHHLDRRAHSDAPVTFLYPLSTDEYVRLFHHASAVDRVTQHQDVPITPSSF
jgi:hypothetical protein